MTYIVVPKRKMLPMQKETMQPEPISTLGTVVAPLQDVATKKYVDDNTIANVVEDTTPVLGGELRADSYKIIELGYPTDGYDATSKAYVDSKVIALTPSDVSASRSAGTTYTCGSKPILVSISLSAINPADGAHIKIHASSDPPTTLVAQTQMDDTGAAQIKATLVAPVPSGWKYRLTNSGCVIDEWVETEVDIG